VVEYIRVGVVLLYLAHLELKLSGSKVKNLNGLSLEL